MAKADKKKTLITDTEPTVTPTGEGSNEVINVFYFEKGKAPSNLLFLTKKS